MRKLVYLICFLSSIGFSQNLVKNPSFENRTGCPVGPSEFRTKVVDWSEPNQATADYYHSCYTPPFTLPGMPNILPSMDVPTNIGGVQPAKTGDGYGAIIVYSLNNWREYLQAEFTSPLVAGQTYCVEFYISLAENSSYSINGFGAYLSNTKLNDPDSTILGVTPQLTFTRGGGYNDVNNWMKLSQQYTAVGGERYMSIGNFNNNAGTTSASHTPTDPLTALAGSAYYYVEDVYVGPCCDIFFDATTTAEVCSNSNGAIDLTVNNGSGNYTYAWSSSQTTQDLSNVTAGSYTVTVTDNTLGCSKDTTIVVSANTTGCCVINLSATTTAETCGAGDGAINLSVAGGSGNYSYAWSNSQTTQDLSNISAGSYTVTVTDVTASCSHDTTIVVSANSTGCCNLSLDTTNTVVNMSTCGNSDGSIIGTVSSTMVGVSFLWIDAATLSIVGNSINLNNVPFGIYYLVANNGTCSDTVGPISVNNSNGPKVNESGVVIQDIGCGTNTGSITGLMVSQGSAPYTYAWVDENGSIAGTNLNLTNVDQGNYMLLVTDANGCQSISSIFEIALFPSFSINVNKSNPTCNASDGSIAVSVTGGKAPYTYQWGQNAGNQTTSLLGNLSENSYCITITDGNNCQEDTCINLVSTTNVSANFNISATVLDLPDTQVELVDNSSSNVTSWKWYVYNQEGVLVDSIIEIVNPIYSFPEEAGAYQVRLVVSGSGCEDDTALSVVINHAAESIFVPNTFTPNGDGFNELFNPYTQNLSKYELEIFDRWGTRIFNTKDGTESWDGKYQNQVCPDGVYIWKITYESFLSVETKIKYGHLILLK